MILAACGDGSTGSTTGVESTGITTTGGSPLTTTPETFTLRGQAQKGPLIFGSRIWVSELDESLNPNGKIYLAQTKDDLGNFVISSTIGSNLVELVSTGYYMDELTGSLSTSPITLSAIADLSIDNTPTINILTTVQAPRLKNLILQGKTYTQAFAQSSNEVLAAFGIDSSKITSLQALYAMQINGTSDQDSALLATSAILSKMSSTAASTNGSSQAAEMSYFLSRIASDISNSGSLTTNSIANARNVAATHLDLAAIRTNIETYYANRGLNIVAPKFEEWIDKDGSGLLPRRLVPATGIAFLNTVNVEPTQVVTSNIITVGGFGLGVVGPVTVSAGTSIIKNGAALSSLNTTAQDGDTIALRRTSMAFGQSTTATVSVGSTSATWQVVTRTPTIVYASGWDNNCGDTGSTTAKYYAHPFIAGSTDAIKYLAIGSGDRNNITSNISSVSIYSNDVTNNIPLTAIGSSNNLANYFNVPLSDLTGTIHPEISFYGGAGTSVFFGSTGIPLTKGAKYWVVVAYPNVDKNDMNRCLWSGVTVDYASRLASSDGASWFGWQGNFPQQSSSSNALPLYMSN